MSRAFGRSLRAMARLAFRTGARALKLAVQPARKPRAARKTPRPRPATLKRVGLSAAQRAVRPALRPALQPALRTAVRPAASTPGQEAAGVTKHWTAGVSLGSHGALRYRLFVPSGLLPDERVPMLTLLHGCTQDAETLASSSRMNQLAQSERFIVLYPQQERLANLYNCWNWYGVRNGQAQREVDAITTAIDDICNTQPVDPKRLAVAGLSAGASLASLLALHQPQRFAAVVMHSGVGPGLASSTATALAAMRGPTKGSRGTRGPKPMAKGHQLPALLVIQGSTDSVVAPSNGALLAQRWADSQDAAAGPARCLQRGQRYPSTVTEFRTQGRLVAALCVVEGLGHAWSGGAPKLPFSDPKGPNASRMAWAFAQKQFSP